MTLPRLRLIAMSVPLVIATGVAGVWIAKPSGVTRVTVPRGAAVLVRLEQTLVSNRSTPGDPFEATLDRPVSVGGMVAIPAGAEIEGKVVDASPSGKGEGPARLRLTLNSIKLNRAIYELHTTDVARYGSGYVNSHWAFAGGAGTVPMPVARGGTGMLIAAPLGAGRVVSASPISASRNVRMPAETPLKFRLIEPLVLPHKR